MSPSPVPLLLFVDGIDGSGKSTFARKLQETLEVAGIRVVLLSVDDFRRPIDWQGAEASQADVYYNDYFDLRLLDETLQKMAGGDSDVRLPIFHEGQPRDWQTLPQPGCDVILVEGVFTQRLATAAHAGLVYVDVNWQVTRERILARDQAKGRSALEVQKRIDARYVPGQRRYEAACQPRSKAHWLATLAGEGEQGLRLARTATPLPPHPLWPAVAEALYNACETPAMNAGKA